MAALMESGAFFTALLAQLNIDHLAIVFQMEEASFVSDLVLLQTQSQSTRYEFTILTPHTRAKDLQLCATFNRPVSCHAIRSAKGFDPE
jgi:hypothetical protein